MTRHDPIATAALIALGVFAAAIVLTLAGITVAELLTRRRRRQAREIEARAAHDAYRTGNVHVVTYRARR